MHVAMTRTKGRFAATDTLGRIAISIACTLIPFSLPAQSPDKGSGLLPATIQDVAASASSNPDSRDQDPMGLLRRLAAEQVLSDSEFLGKTRFRMDLQGRTFFYDLKPAPTTFMLAADDPYLVPLEALIRIEVLRRDFRASIPDEDFWTAPLDSIEAAVRRCVEDLEAPRPEPGTRAPELTCATRIQAQFDKLRDSILSFAAAHKLTLLEPPQTRDPAPGYRIQVKIDPPRARVRVMPLLEYKKYQYFKVPLEQYQWNDLLDSENDMIGWYHYRAEWPAELNGTEEGDFCIKKPGSITFKPRER